MAPAVPRALNHSAQLELSTLARAFSTYFSTSTWLMALIQRRRGLESIAFSRRRLALTMRVKLSAAVDRSSARCRACTSFSLSVLSRCWARRISVALTSLVKVTFTGSRAAGMSQMMSSRKSSPTSSAVMGSSEMHSSLVASTSPSMTSLRRMYLTMSSLYTSFLRSAMLTVFFWRLRISFHCPSFSLKSTLSGLIFAIRSAELIYILGASTPISAL
mmetsp:Transcript_2274/g.4828  ORF Transcript_2274/g.4828 Transcript_2274/m.4828 type:complete len:217 (-) Transcript_2274:267-917(-)